jgi:hypothetical protein
MGLAQWLVPDYITGFRVFKLDSRASLQSSPVSLFIVRLLSINTNGFPGKYPQTPLHYKRSSF